MQHLTHIQVQELLGLIEQHFDAAYYHEANPDVAQANTDPWGHYILFGIPEGRAPSTKLGGMEMLSLISDVLGTPASRLQLEQLYRHYRTSKSITARLRAFGRRTVDTSARALGLTRGTSDYFIKSKATAADLVRRSLNLSAFNALSPNDRVFGAEAQAIEYLMTEGYLQLHPLDFHLQPDLVFYRSLYPQSSKISDSALYKDWLDDGIAMGRFISESHLLNYFGSTSTEALSWFPHEAYANAYPDIPSAWPAERILLHFLDAGVPEGRFAFKFDARTIRLVEEIIQQINNRDRARALALSEKFLILGHDSVKLRLMLTDHYKWADQLAGARLLLEGLSTSVPIENFWINYHKADIAKRASDLKVAGEWLEAASEFERDSFWVEGECEQLSRREFSEAEKLARASAENGDTERAQKMLDAAIASASDRMRPYGGNTRSFSRPPRTNIPTEKRPLRVGLLADLFLPQCKLYRVDQKLEQLRNAGIEVELYDFRKDSKRAFEEAGLFDLWVFYRVPALFDVLRVIDMANRLGKPTFYEIDDLLFDPAHFPEPLSAYDQSVSKQEYVGLQLATSYTSGAVKLCEFGIASTPSLSEQLAKLVRSGGVVTHRNALSSPHMQAIGHLSKNLKSKRPGSRLRIFYGSGTKAHKDFLQDTLFAAVGDVMDKFPHVEFHTIGHVDAPALKSRFATRIVQSEPIWNVQDYWAHLNLADINVSALKRSLLTDCKSEIKWLEAAMLGVPSVVSATQTMAETITEGETGLLARTRKEWSEKLTLLVEDASLRASIGNQARNTVLREYNVETMSASLRDGILKLLETRHQIQVA